MQNTNRAKQGQSFIDMVYQQTGSFEDLIASAILNGTSVTKDIAIGDEIQTPAVRNLKNYLALQKRNPATAIRTQFEQREELEGIGYWIIANNFKVS